MKICYGYGRGSTAKQTLTLEGQQERCRDHYDRCLKDEYLWGGFHGESASGAKSYKDRVSGKLLANMNRGDCLVVAKLDRLGRSMFDLVDFCRALEQAGVTLICLDPQVDTSTPHGRLLFNIMASMAEYELELISERIASTKATLRKKKYASGGRMPYGWTSEKVADGHRLVPSETERAFMRSLPELHAKYKADRKRILKARKRTQASQPYTFITWLDENGYRFRGRKIQFPVWQRMRRAAELGFPMTYKEC